MLSLGNVSVLRAGEVPTVIRSARTGATGLVAADSVDVKMGPSVTTLAVPVPVVLGGGVFTVPRLAQRASSVLNARASATAVPAPSVTM